MERVNILNNDNKFDLSYRIKETTESLNLSCEKAGEATVALRTLRDLLQYLILCVANLPNFQSFDVGDDLSKYLQSQESQNTAP